MATSSIVQKDVTIIGGGLAGLSASLEIAKLNPSLSVLLVEKDKKVGGNSAKASSGINAAVSVDDEPVFRQDTLRSGGGLAVEPLVDALVDQSAAALTFLSQFDVDLSVLCQLGGHSAKRTHRNPSGPNVGFAIVSALQKAALTYPNIEILTGASAEQLLLQETESDSSSYPKAVAGVRVLTQDGATVHVQSPAVILATGGFSANRTLLQQFAPGMETFPTTNGPCAQGDGIRLAQELGADLVLMDKVQLHPTAFVNPKDRTASQRFLAPEAIRGSGALLFNRDSRRFVDELSTRDKVSQAILAQKGQTGFLLLFEGASALASSLGFYKHIGLVTVTHSVAEAAAHCELDATTVLEELNAYAHVCAGDGGSQCDQFGKHVFPYPIAPIDSVDAPIEIHVMEVAPAVHYCMGGVKIDEQAHVLDAQGARIKGLFAAGEVSGGLHGGNRLGGNSLAECVVFGRVAAQQAVKEHSK